MQHRFQPRSRGLVSPSWSSSSSASRVKLGFTLFVWFGSGYLLFKILAFVVMELADPAKVFLSLLPPAHAEQSPAEKTMAGGIVRL